MILPLEDGGVNLFDWQGNKIIKESPFYEMLAKEFVQSDDETESDFWNFAFWQFRRWFQNVEHKYLQKEATWEKSFASDIFREANIGYIYSEYLEMFYADENAFLQFEKVIESFANKDGIILDLRFAEGFEGGDNTALKLASYFCSTPTNAFVKDAAVVHSIEPAPRAFAGPVVVLISEATVGTAEVLVLSLSQLPNVTLLGRTTDGSLGSFDLLYRRLPNNWVFGLPTHEYTDPVSGKNFEKVGISPDVTTQEGLWPKQERDKGYDSWLDEALALLDSMKGMTLSVE